MPYNVPFFHFSEVYCSYSEVYSHIVKYIPKPWTMRPNFYLSLSQQQRLFSLSPGRGGPPPSPACGDAGVSLLFPRLPSLSLYHYFSLDLTAGLVDTVTVVGERQRTVLVSCLIANQRRSLAVAFEPAAGTPSCPSCFGHWMMPAVSPDSRRRDSTGKWRRDQTWTNLDRKLNLV